MSKQIPEIRFKEFTDEWEQRKFDEAFGFPVSTNSLSRAKLNYESGIVKSVHYGDILINYNTVLDVKADIIPFITEGELTKYESNLLRNRDLVFADAAEDLSVGKAVEISNITTENVVAGLHTIVARAKIQKGEYFLGYYINSDNYHRQLLRLMQGTKVSSISKGSLKETKVSMPRILEEQEKIGNLFKTLDKTITLHLAAIQRQQRLKKAMLQKLFPIDEATIPAVHFAFFSEEWDQRKFEKIWRRTSEKNKNLKFNSSDILSVAKMKYSDAPKNSTDEYMKTYYVLKKGDIAFEGNKSKDYSFGRFVLNDVADGIVSHVFITFEPVVPMDTDFMKEYINNEEVMKRKLVKSTTKTLMMTTLNVKDINKQEMLMPSLEEQKKIGAFFKSLDNTIALHHQALEKLKLLKQSLLQKMFI